MLGEIDFSVVTWVISKKLRLLMPKMSSFS